MLDMGNLHEGKKTYVRTRALKTGGRHLLVNEGGIILGFYSNVTANSRLCNILYEAVWHTVYYL